VGRIFHHWSHLEYCCHSLMVNRKIRPPHKIEGSNSYSFLFCLYFRQKGSSLRVDNIVHWRGQNRG
jgi:hypothetical protein